MTAASPPLAGLVPVGADPDEVYAAFAAWATGRGLPPYPHQDEALVALLAGENVVLSTPTGSGKSLVAVGAHLAALAGDRVSFYSAPIKALVSEKFFELCELFGASEVGMLTGDASVNPDAPVICCTAEILANMALRDGASADYVVMDEFHYYADRERGVAWQVPLLCLPNTTFLLMSATLGDVTNIAEGLTEKTGRLPVNPSGGLKAKGHPIGATGVSMHAVTAMQLTGTAGDMQIDNASLGGIFNMGGTAVANYVSILERIK